MLRNSKRLDKRKIRLDSNLFYTGLLELRIQSMQFFFFDELLKNFLELDSRLFK